MSHLTIDFESRSAVTPKNVGTWKYSEHPTTDVTCLAVKVDDEKPMIWFPDWVLKIFEGYLVFPFPWIGYSELKGLIASATTIEAHNAEFERAEWLNQMVKKHGFSDLPLEKMRCSAAKAAMHSLPRALDKVIKALGLPVEKDLEGYKLMMKMCKPRNLVKKELMEIALAYAVGLANIKQGYALVKAASFSEDVSTRFFDSQQQKTRGYDYLYKDFLRWHETPEQIIRLAQYCAQDVEAEYALSKKLLDLPDKEQKLWFLDQKINQRGLRVDVDSVKGVIKSVQEKEKELLIQMENISGIKSPRQVAATLSWINERLPSPLPPMENIQKATVSDILKIGYLPVEIRKILEIRQQLSRSSVSKLDTLLRMACADNRIRGLFMYHGAGTGRWSGKGFQPHNLPRKGYKDIEGAIRALLYSSEMTDMLYDGTFETAMSVIRSMIMAEDGKKIMCADFSSIEGRVLAWLAKEDWVLDDYREEKCAYCSFAAKIFNLPYGEIYGGHKDGVKLYKDMRFEGKTGELACGYQGGERAVFNFAPDMPLEKRERIVSLWRKNRPKTVGFWYEIQRIAIKAVQEAPKIKEFNGIRFGVRKNFLCCRLPSGRVLFYYDPKIVDKGHFGPGLTYMGVNSYTRKWERIDTYGGKLTENIVQAIARDILREAMFNLEDHGYEIVLHVHDEIAVEIEKGYGQNELENFCNLMSIPPEWAPDLPLGADGWIGKRYRK